MANKENRLMAMDPCGWIKILDVSGDEMVGDLDIYSEMEHHTFGRRGWNQPWQHVMLFVFELCG